MDQYTQPVRLDLGELYAFAGPTNLNDCLAIVWSIQGYII